MSTNGDVNAAAGSLGQLLQLQADFQARMAEETLRYLRRVQGVFEPHTPGTVIQPEQPEALTAAGVPGGRATVSLEVEYRQRVHAVLFPALTPLVGENGTTWYADAETAPSLALLATDEVRTVTVTVSLPAVLPPGSYRGLLVLRGLRAGGVPLVVTVTAPEVAS